MGQGFSLTTLPANSVGIDAPELADLQYEKSLGKARFMKTVRARHKDGLVTAKVVMKPYADLSFHENVKRLLHERKALADVPNALAYHRIIETSTNGYLVRQYIHSSLYDRLNTRPFLEDIEKKWLSFQLLCAVRDCHARGIYHGDIKTENVLVTSWNWLYLSDFSSSYKPTYLPEDNPADFSFYFDNSDRRTAYLAPERFLVPGSEPEGEQDITWAMDMFSVGCVIAELFLESPIFTLSQLFKYRNREYDPTLGFLSKIQDANVRELVSHMIQLDPNSRLSAEEYLTFWKGKAFPHYFYGFLQQYMHTMTDPSSGRNPVTSGIDHLGEPDERIEKIYGDFDKISVLLSSDNEQTPPPQTSPQLTRRLFPLHVDIPNSQHQSAPTPGPAIDDGNLIFLTTVISCLRATARATSRVRGCELLLAFSEKLTDEAKLDRVIPYITNLLNDKSDLVRIQALRVLTQVLDNVQVVSPINAYIFPEYILPKLESFLPGSSLQPSVAARMDYAWCIGTLALTARKYLDITQALRADGSLPTADLETEESMASSAYRNSYSTDQNMLANEFEVHVKALLTDTETSVRRTILNSVADLCVFFGNQRANEVVLSHLNTYLNDRDWMLKCSFFDSIVGVAVFIGGPSLEGFILPLMVQALFDPEEFVVEKVLRAFSSIAGLGLFQRSKIWELVDIVARLTMHPNMWIREAAAQFITASSKHLDLADVHSILVNLIKPYLKVIPADFSELRILDSLKKPLPKIVMDKAFNWALHAEKGLFWVPAKKQQTFTFGSGEDTLPTISGRELDPKVLQRAPKNDEDEQWLKNLRSAGMSFDDEFKLFALREWIWRVAQRRKADGQSPNPPFNNIMALHDIGIIPQTILFDNARKVIEEVNQNHYNEEQSTPPRTIADALLDASTTEYDAQGNRNPPHPDTHAGRLIREEARLKRPASTIPKISSSPDPGSSQESPSSDVGSHRNALPIRSAGQSPSAQSPVGSLGADPGPSLRHRNSALSLIKRGDNKASAETGSTSANAFGKVDGAAREASRTRQPTSPLAMEHQHRSPSRAKFRDAHNYTGNDPTVLKLLDSILLEKFPSDELEFGPRIQINSRRQPIKRRDTHPSAPGTPWRPEGVLVAMFGEHKAAVTRILVALDQSFFITGSDDGTVKVWDPSRLERNVTRRSKQTFSLAEGVKVSSLIFLEQTYCFAVTGDDGSVVVVRIDYTPTSGGGHGKWGRLKVLREHQLEDGEFAVWSEHYKDDNKSVLLLATNTSKVIALDLRTMEEIFILQNPLQHGTPTCFCVDRKHQWLLLGTSHGVLSLWDLRFKLRLKAWCFQNATPIHRIVYRHTRSSRTRIYITGGTGAADVTVWDIEKLICKEVYRTGTNTSSKDTSITKSTTLIDLDEEKGGGGGGGMLGRFAVSLEPTAKSSVDQGIRAMCVTSQAMEEGGETKHTFLLTAGPDWKIRYWDTGRPESSLVVSGLGVDEAKAQYTVSTPTPDTTVVSERLSQPQNHQANVGRERDRSRTGDSSSRSKTTQKSRSAAISTQQQYLLKSHLDTILDIALLEWPYGMVVSADRAGVIYLFM